MTCSPSWGWSKESASCKWVRMPKNVAWAQKIKRQHSPSTIRNSRLNSLKYSNQVIYTHLNIYTTFFLGGWVQREKRFSSALPQKNWGPGVALMGAGLRACLVWGKGAELKTKITGNPEVTWQKAGDLNGRRIMKSNVKTMSCLAGLLGFGKIIEIVTRPPK